MPVDTDRVREYVRLTKRRRELEAQAETIKRECADIERELIEQFATDGVQNIKTDDGTAYLTSQIWAAVPRDDNGAPQYDRANDALRRVGLGQFVQERFNSQTVSAWIRELDRDELGHPILPPELDGALDVSTVWKVGVRAK